MERTTFVDRVSTIYAAWLNAIDAAVVALANGEMYDNVFIGLDSGLSFSGTTVTPAEGCIRVTKAEDPRAGSGHTLGGPVDFFITPYNAGMSIEFKGIVECWVEDWSIHNNNRGGGLIGEPANLWIGDNLDIGGVRISGVINADQSVQYGEIVSERFTDLSHGDLRFVVRDDADGFGFRWGAKDADVEKVRITKTGVRIPHGSAPASPVDGDIWTTSAGLFVRINGVTKAVTLT
jgi:hypothetical protein